MKRKIRFLALLAGVAFGTQAYSCTGDEVIGTMAIGIGTIELIKEAVEIFEPGTFGAQPSYTGTPSAGIPYRPMRNSTPDVPGAQRVGGHDCERLRQMAAECRRRHAAIGGGTQGQAEAFLTCANEYEKIYRGAKCG